jgi:acyl-CoA synthetase (AMP-forming)/AMP-acid ligase II
MRRDNKGNLWFVSRKKDLIVRGGSNISPVEVEGVLAPIPTHYGPTADAAGEHASARIGAAAANGDHDPS